MSVVDQTTGNRQAKEPRAGWDRCLALSFFGFRDITERGPGAPACGVILGTVAGRRVGRSGFKANVVSLIRSSACRSCVVQSQREREGRIRSISSVKEVGVLSAHGASSRRSKSRVALTL